MDTTQSSGHLTPPVLQNSHEKTAKWKEIVAISYRPCYNKRGSMAVGRTVTAGGRLALDRLAGFCFMSVRKIESEINHNKYRGFPLRLKPINGKGELL